MKLIKNNPYRTLGLLVGSGVKEELKKHRRLKMLMEAGQDVPDDFSFPVLGKLNLDNGTVDAAHLQLDLDKDRVNAALFWFYNGGTADEPAFDYLKEGKIDNAIRECWNRVYPAATITKNNSSAFHNLSTLKLNIAINDTSININLLEEAITLKLRYLDSDFYQELVRLSTDETFKISRENLQKQFLDQLQCVIESNGGITIAKYLEVINSMVFSAKQDYIRDFIKKPFEDIENLIEETSVKRSAKATGAITAGKALIKKTTDHFEQLRIVLNPGDIKFVDISDKVAQELLNCTIDYFEHHEKSGGDNKAPFESALKLVEAAKYFALGEFVTLRVNEYIAYITKRISTTESMGKVKIQAAALSSIFDAFKTWRESGLTVAVYPCYVLKYVLDCKPLVNHLQTVLGSGDSIFIDAAQRVVVDATHSIIDYINDVVKMQNATTLIVSASQNGRRIIDVLAETMNMLSTFHMSTESRVNFNEHKSAIDKVAQETRGNYAGSGSGSGSSDGCYIATMVYGNYDHPQVIVLRQFRDMHLMTSRPGRLFVKLYYAFSPWLVNKLKNKKGINKVIRIILDRFTKMIHQ